MTKYTDADFGFSFWYPSGWKVSSTQVNSETTKEIITLSSGKTLLSVTVVYSQNVMSGAQSATSKTIGGLPLIPFTDMRDETLVPVAADYVVYVARDQLGGYLAKTIATTVPAFTTPASADEQIKAIQAEKDAHAGQ